MALREQKKYSEEDTPDHVIEEIRHAAIELTKVMVPIIDSLDENVAFNALHWVHASFIKHLLADNPEELRKAAKLAGEVVASNIETMIVKEKQNDAN